MTGSVGGSAGVAPHKGMEESYPVWGKLQLPVPSSSWSRDDIPLNLHFSFNDNLNPFLVLFDSILQDSSVLSIIQHWTRYELIRPVVDGGHSISIPCFGPKPPC